jgi:hypothetical protein
VVIRRKSSDHIEAVRDTVRQQQLEVERPKPARKAGKLASSLVFLSQLLALCQP